MDIIHAIPHVDFLKHWLTNGGSTDSPFHVQCAGGFPLYLIGGADAYNDIDLYTNDMDTFEALNTELRRDGLFFYPTPHTNMYLYHGDHIQVVRPGFRAFTDDELLQNADMSASACLLQYADNQFSVRALYPDDIRNRVCVVLNQHTWTTYRKRVYRAKGYTIR